MSPDETIAKLVARSRVAPLDAFFGAVRNAGRGGILAAAAAAAAGSKNGRAAHGAAGALGAFGASVLLARVVGRARPCERGVSSIVDCPDGPSFPSDQVAAAFAAAAFVGVTSPEHARAAAAVASVVALGRVYVGVHYPSDVVAGALFGTAFGSAAADWPQGKGR